jgi:hypothetical protein
MQNFRFLLQKMEVEEASPISYSLVSAQGDARIDLTAMLGKRIHLQYHGDTECLNCGRTDRIFSQGFCYLCHQTSPESSDCILRPELCRGHLGLGRDARFEFEQHAQPHFVYLAATSNVKVGVTRTLQRPTRWIDQGALSAVAIAATPYRALAGRIEVALKSVFSDKTPRDKMLKGEDDAGIQFTAHLPTVLKALPPSLLSYLIPEEDWELHRFEYPVLAYPTKPQTLKLDRPFSWSGTLLGIRGQYLLLEGDLVVNLRSHSGYWLDIGF